MLALVADLGWKSAVVAAAVLLIAFALGRRAAAERVAVLRAGIFALLILPLAALLLPALEIALLPAVDVAAGPLAPSAGATGWTAHDTVLLAYIGVAALLMLRLLTGVAVLRHWTRTAAPVDDAGWSRALAEASAGMRRPVRLRVSEKAAAPISWGLSPAWILVPPQSLDRGEQAEAVIAHEMAHIRSLDWPMLIAARIAVALFWFDPLVWLVARALVRQTELAADAVALARVAPADYAQALLGAAMPHGRHALACGMTVERGALASRIQRVLAGNAARPHRALSLALAFDVLIAAAPLSAVQFVRVAPPAGAARVAVAPAAVPVIQPAVTAMPPPSRPAIADMPPRTRRAAAQADGRRAQPIRRSRATTPAIAARDEATEARPRHEAHAEQAMRHAAAASPPPARWQARLAHAPDAFVKRAERVAKRLARQERQRNERLGWAFVERERLRSQNFVRPEGGWAWRPPPPRPAGPAGPSDPSSPTSPSSPSGQPTTDS